MPTVDSKYTHMFLFIHIGLFFPCICIHTCVYMYIHVQCTQTWLSGTITRASMPTADSKYTHMFLSIHTGLFLICTCTYICVQLYIHVQYTQTWLSGTITSASMPTADSKYSHVSFHKYRSFWYMHMCMNMCVCIFMRGKYTYMYIYLWRVYTYVSYMGLFYRISSLLQGSFAKVTYNFKEPTNRSHTTPQIYLIYGHHTFVVWGGYD